MNDTIAAIATASGQGAIGIIRLSGPQSQPIGSALFTSSSSVFSGFKPCRMHHGRIVSANGAFVDDVLCVYMPGPNSFTGEDVFEIHGHGGQAVLHQILQECLQRGARPALQGEFSKRAFMNGRMDLTQAEAIMELIAAPAPAAMGFAGTKLEGHFGQHIRELRARLDHLRVELCVAVDFPEDELECLNPDVFSSAVDDVIAVLEKLIDNHMRRQVWQQGALVVLAGQVNAGKSSLMNAVLGVSRAIVTDIPGTTRDYLEEQIQLDGLPVRLVDTAGLRASPDAVERLGIERSQEMLRAADLVLLIVDADLGPSHEDEMLLRQYEKLIVVLNKIDLLDGTADWADNAPWTDRPSCRISAKSGSGVAELLQTLRAQLAGSDALSPDELVPNLRQKEALQRAVYELLSLREEIGSQPYDLLGVRLDLASSILAEITGEMTAQDLLDRVFDGFCVGK